MNFFRFLGFLGKKNHSNYCQLRDLHAWPRNWRSRNGLRDFFIFACIYPTAMNFRLFREVFRSRNSFQLSPFAWPSRVTLELKVTVYVIFVISTCICPTEMIVFCFVRFLVQGIHSNYCQLRDLHAWPWKPKITSLSTWLFCFVRLLKHVDHDGIPYVSRSHVMVTQVAIVRMNSLIWKPVKTKNHCGRTHTSA